MRTVMNPRIRTAKFQDIEALHALVERAYRGDTARAGWTHEADLLDGQRTDAEALHAMLGDPAQHILIAEQDGVLAGCVNVSDHGNQTAHLGMLAIDPARQAAGLGRTLIAAAEYAAAEVFGALRMEMTVIRQREELIAYYERRGYVRTGEERPFPLEDRRFGLPKRGDLSFVVLSKPLSQS